MQFDVDIEYSSTCPCSAALSRQLIKEKFTNEIKEPVDIEQVTHWIEHNTSFATPHSQRSIATISIKKTQNLDFLMLIDLAESTLKTATQTAVKRLDEQFFAQLNGENLMFVEDAIRRLHHTLQQHYPSFELKVNHLESLHSHNAVAYIN